MVYEPLRPHQIEKLLLGLKPRCPRIQQTNRIGSDCLRNLLDELTKEMPSEEINRVLAGVNPRLRYRKAVFCQRPQDFEFLKGELRHYDIMKAKIKPPREIRYMRSGINQFDIVLGTAPTDYAKSQISQERLSWTRLKKSFEADNKKKLEDKVKDCFDSENEQKFWERYHDEYTSKDPHMPALIPQYIAKTWGRNGSERTIGTIDFMMHFGEQMVLIELNGIGHYETPKEQMRKDRKKRDDALSRGYDFRTVMMGNKDKHDKAYMLQVMQTILQDHEAIAKY